MSGSLGLVGDYTMRWEGIADKSIWIVRLEEGLGGDVFDYVAVPPRVISCFHVDEWLIGEWDMDGGRRAFAINIAENEVSFRLCLEDVMLLADLSKAQLGSDFVTSLP